MLWAAHPLSSILVVIASHAVLKCRTHAAQAAQDWRFLLRPPMTAWQAWLRLLSPDLASCAKDIVMPLASRPYHLDAASRTNGFTLPCANENLLALLQRDATIA